jgi:hypothetical protein
VSGEGCHEQSRCEQGGCTASRAEVREQGTRSSRACCAPGTGDRSAASLGSRRRGGVLGRSVENLEEVAWSDCVEEASRKHAVLEESVARYFGSLGPVAACRDLRVRGSQIPAAKKELDGQEK